VTAPGLRQWSAALAGAVLAHVLVGYLVLSAAVPAKRQAPRGLEVSLDPAAPSKQSAPAKRKAHPKPQHKAKVRPKPQAKPRPKTEAKAKPKPEAKAKPKPEIKAKLEAKPKAKLEAKAKPEPKAEPKPKIEPKPRTRPTPEPSRPVAKPVRKPAKTPTVKQQADAAPRNFRPRARLRPRLKPARRGSREGGARASRPSLQQASRGAPPGLVADYLARVQDWLRRYNRYPDAARRAGLQDRVAVTFVIDRWGRVLSFSVLRGSGQPVLDAAARDLLRRASPLPAMPRAIGRRVRTMRLGYTVEFLARRR